MNGTNGYGNGLGYGFEYDEPANPKKRFLVGYRKFIVALIWMLLTGWSTVWVLLEKAPPTGKVSIVLWLISSAGFFCAFFIGGQALARMWAAKYAPPQTTIGLTQHTQQEQKQVDVVYKYNVQEDSAFSKAFEGEENDLPPAKPRGK